MNIYITAQIIGFLGYIFLTSATSLKKQDQIIRMDILACSFLCLQWIMLEQPTLMILNALNLSISILVLQFKGQYIVQKSMIAIYPIGCFALICVSQETLIDVLCIICFCLIVRAKLSNDIITFRYFSIMAGAILTVCAFISASLPAIIFNALFVLLHLHKNSSLSMLLLRKQPTQ